LLQDYAHAQKDSSKKDLRNLVTHANHPSVHHPSSPARERKREDRAGATIQKPTRQTMKKTTSKVSKETARSAEAAKKALGAIIDTIFGYLPSPTHYAPKPTTSPA